MADTDTLENLRKKGIIQNAEFIKDKPKKVIRVSPAIDFGIGGGIPLGSWVILTGKPKTGKSSTAVHILSNYLEQIPDGKVLYVDVEGRVKPIQLQNDKLLKYINTDRFEVMRSVKKDIMSAERLLSAAELFIKENTTPLVVIDSTSALCSSSEQMDAVLNPDSRSRGPKILAAFCRRNAHIVPIQDAIVIMITHLMPNVTGYGSAFIEDSGNKIQYQSDIKLRCKKTEDWLVEGRQVGQHIHWSVEWSALGPPGREFKSSLKYNYGIDEIMELIELCKDFGVIEGSTWLKFVFNNEELKFQGKEKLYTFLCENTDAVAHLRKELTEITLCM